MFYQQLFVQPQKGQSLVLVALAMVVLVAFVGLALDGGLAYSERREAQNATDAAAMAGSYELRQQLWVENRLPGNIDQDAIMREILWAAELHNVPDTDPGNDLTNGNIQAFYTSSEGNTLCEVTVCSPVTVATQASGIFVQALKPFDTFFAGLVGINELSMSASSVAVVHAGDRGFNKDYWAMFARDNQGCNNPEAVTTGPSVFISVDPGFGGGTGGGFAFANVHSNGAFHLSPLQPMIPGQVTYQTNCIFCYSALITPEVKNSNVELPDFGLMQQLSFEKATEAGQFIIGDQTWGALMPNAVPPLPPTVQGIWFIDGSLTIPQDNWLWGGRITGGLDGAFIFVNGNVTINGILIGTNVTIVATGFVNVNGTMQTQGPFDIVAPTTDPYFENNTVALWSEVNLGAPAACNQAAITVETTIPNPPIPNLVSANNNNNISGSVIAPHGLVIFGAQVADNTVNGAVIGDTVQANSNIATGFATNIRYNGLYFPPQPDRIELLR